MQLYRNGPELPRFDVIWNHVSIHQAALVQDWFTYQNNFTDIYFTEFFLAWRWKVYDRQPHAHLGLLQAMEEACRNTELGVSAGFHTAYTVVFSLLPSQE